MDDYGIELLDDNKNKIPPKEEKADKKEELDEEDYYQETTFEQNKAPVAGKATEADGPQ